jgi:hypothetical protein
MAPFASEARVGLISRPLEQSRSSHVRGDRYRR